MLMPRHDIVSAGPSGVSPRRAMAIGGVGLLHVAAIYALIAGMTGEIIKVMPGDIAVRFLDPSTPPRPAPVPQPPPMTHPTVDTTPAVQPPVFNIVDPAASTIRVTSASSHTPPVPDSGAMGVSNTHTTPPYPVDARALSHQGTVLLQMTVSPQGDVVAANVVQSSGFAELDATAVSWVMAHWKYRPAIHGGISVTSQTRAAVKFDLKQVRG